MFSLSAPFRVRNGKMSNLDQEIYVISDEIAVRDWILVQKLALRDCGDYVENTTASRPCMSWRR
jgi:hypothetical protein